MNICSIRSGRNSRECSIFLSFLFFLVMRSSPFLSHYLSLSWSLVIFFCYHLLFTSLFNIIYPWIYISIAGKRLQMILLFLNSLHMSIDFAALSLYSLSLSLSVSRSLFLFLIIPSSLILTYKYVTFDNLHFHIPRACHYTLSALHFQKRLPISDPNCFR